MSNAWSAFYWRDYVADTGHLTLAQHGAYLLLMAHYYITGRPIPVNAEQVHRICRCTTDADRHAAEQVLREFFSLEGDLYRHSRVDAELAKAVDISAKRRAAANVKHQKSSANAQQVQVQMYTQPQPQSQSQTRAKTPSDADASAPDDFEPLDQRYTPVREFIHEMHLKNFRVKCQWDGSEAKALDRLLSANLSWTEEQILEMVRNRFESEGIASERPRKWLPNIGSYAAGPQDRYNKLKGADRNGNGTGNRAGQRQAINLAAAAAAKRDLGLVG
jgi:uncharacterized protein YdaU (DUF1376 family)